MSVKHVPSNRACSFTSKLITFECTWTIKNITRLSSDGIMGQPVLYSPIFIVAPPEQITTEDKQEPVQFQLSFYLKGEDNENRDFVGIYLQLKDGPILNIMYTHSVMMANGQKRQLWTSIREFDRAYCDLWGSSNVMRRAELFNPVNGYVSNDSLTLHCELNIIMAEANKPEQRDQLKNENSQPNLLAKSFGDLLESGAHSNVTFVLVDDGGQELCAHKDILVARSRVFADMFESKMAESVTNRVEIVETRVEVFKQVLHFIYTGKVEASLDAIGKDLLICADKYQLDLLKSICEEHLSSSITTESNLSDLLELATLHDAPKLKAKVVDSMRKSIETQLQHADKVVQVNKFLSSLATERTD